MWSEDEQSAKISFTEKLRLMYIQERKIIAYVLFLLIIFGLMAYHTKTSRSQGDVKKEKLRTELNLIKPLPGAIRNDLSSVIKTDNSVVSAGYRSNKSYKEIRSFYIEEAPKSGWVFLKEETIRDWGRDLGGKTIDFRKGDYILSIQYAGEKADYGWDFAVDLSLGSR